MVFPRGDGNIQVVREACTILREEVIIFSCAVVVCLKPFGSFGRKICEIQVRLWNKKL